MSTTKQNFKQKLSFYYGDERIDFERKTSKKTARNIRITISHTGDVSVSAPKKYHDYEIIPIVQKRGRWITKKLKEIHENMEQIAPRQYVSGETHYYLGSQYQLKVLNDKSKKQSVYFEKNYLYVNTHKIDKERICALLNNWYREQAKIFFHQRLIELVPRTKWVNECPPLKVRKMKRQWGNCAINGQITLNTHLIKAPIFCIDYVILHELCHIAEHNHSKNFYRLMSQVLPNWKDTKTYLDNKAGLYL